MSKRIDLTGQQFGRLTVISFAGTDKSGKARWNCQCECGNTTETYGQGLLNGMAKSCGCLHREVVARNNTTHNMTGTRIYNIWHDMKERTRNKNNKRYDRYGGRGITLCKEWGKYENFYTWSIENGYKENLTIDRIDNNKGYSPDNCRWTTQAEQNRNKSDNVLIEHNGETKTVAEWAKEKNMTYDCLRYRIKRGWSIEKALETPVKKKHCP